jgi:hypothetical protein
VVLYSKYGGTEVLGRGVPRALRSRRTRRHR